MGDMMMYAVMLAIMFVDFFVHRFTFITVIPGR